MVKMRSQTGKTTIKKEEEDCKPILNVDSASMTIRNKITKRKPSKTLPVQQVKVEEETDIKSLLKSRSKSSKGVPKPRISQEQINQLIHYIVNDNISVAEASRKVNLSYHTAGYYYNLYKNDPEKKIPSPRNQLLHPRKYYKQEQIGNLIRCINDNKMTLTEASAKVNMPYTSANCYYNTYMKDPNHNIPIPRWKQSYTQDQKNEFIDYIINDKMSIKAASKKAKMNFNTAGNYYHKYFRQRNPDIAKPRHISSRSYFTQGQIKQVISYIADDNMSIAAALRKANMSRESTRRHYQQYLKDNNIEQYVSSNKPYPQDDINKFIRYVVDDKMTIKAASKKANMSEPSGSRYYRKYLKNHNLDLRPHKYAQDKIKELIRYIVDDKMTLTAVSKKANMSPTTSHKYYYQYLKAHHLDIPQKYITQDQKNELVGYIVHDNMSINAAAKKANMSSSAGRVYYHQYLKITILTCAFKMSSHKNKKVN